MLPDPVGEVIESSIRPNGLKMLKVRVPLGVVFFIYESRPNVTADAAAICVKSGNAVILRGGKEAANSSQAIVDLLREALDEAGLPADAVQLVDTPDRDAVGHFLAPARIHRRGHSARRREPDSPRRRRSHDAGHQAFHRQLPRLRRSRRRSGNGRADHVNSKCQRLGVCNAAESLLVHADVAAEFLPRIGERWCERGIEIRGDAKTREFVPLAKASDRGRLRHRISRPDHLGAGRRLARRSDRAHQPLRFAAHRRDRDRRSGRRPQFTAASIARR